MRAVLVSLVILVAGGASFGLARWSEGTETPDVRTRGSALPRASEDRLLIAGSGSNVILTRALVDDLEGARVFGSIGSGGGLRALREGVIDVALVSRPLRPNEAEGYRAVPYARTALVWAVHRHARVRSTTTAELARLYERGGRWAGGGRAVPFLRELGDSGISVVRRNAPAIADAHDASVRARRFEILLTDQAMRRALSSVEDAFGLTDLGQLGRAKAIAVDGVMPSLDTLDEYPFIRTLSFVFPEPASADVRRLLEHVRTETGFARTRAHGYEPVP